MTANSLAEDWTTQVIDFLSNNIPRFDTVEEGWDHMFLTAYEIGCEALVALGQADEAGRGATPRKNAALPDVLPRWDDLCLALLDLAEQQDLLSYRLPNGNVLPSETGLIIRPKNSAPVPNIVAAQGLGPAYAMPHVLSVLQVMGLVAEGHWTEAAETVLWRVQPEAWALDVTSDQRFCNEVGRTLASIPADIRAEMDKIVAITDADIAIVMKQSVKVWVIARAKYGPKVYVSPPLTTGQARRSLEHARRNDLDSLFFRRWRLADGWLAPSEAQRALEIFHDPLAIAMRHAVTSRLYPSLAFLAE